MDLKWKVKIYGRDKGKFDLKKNRTEMRGEKEGKRKGLWCCFFAVPVRGYSSHDRFVSGAHIHSATLQVAGD